MMVGLQYAFMLKRLKDAGKGKRETVKLGINVVAKPCWGHAG